jgi:hypothetical protein
MVMCCIFRVIAHKYKIYNNIYIKHYIPAVGPIQPPSQRVPRALSLGI